MRLLIWLISVVLFKRFVIVLGEGKKYTRRVIYTSDDKAYVIVGEQDVPPLFLDNPAQKKGEFRNGRKFGFYTWFDV